MTVRPVPEGLLFHYTSNEVLFKILESGEIWLSDTRFLNDSREWKHASTIVAHTITSLADRWRKDWEAHGCRRDQFDTMIENMARRFEGLPLEGSWPDKDYGTTPFIFSMSSDPDSLSQWRAYGPCCIGFDRELLSKAIGCDPTPVTYPKVDISADVERLMTSYIEYHRRHIQTGGVIESEVRSSGWAEIESDLRRSEFFLTKKHKGFEDERELRFIKRLVPTDKIFFRGGAYPVPHTAAKIFEKGSDPSKIIRQIIYGPGVDRQRAETAFQMMFEFQKIKIEVNFSSIPFRAS